MYAPTLEGRWATPLVAKGGNELIKRFAAAVILLLAILLTNLPAHAAVAWCRGDPQVLLDGTLVEIEIALDAPPEYLLKFAGPTRYTIQKPAAVEHVLVPTEAIGMNPHGARVEFTDGGTVEGTSFPVTIDVVVPLNHGPHAVIATELTVRILNGEEAGREEKVSGTSDLTTMQLTIKGTDFPIGHGNEGAEQ
jgi:hypothetical protein